MDKKLRAKWLRALRGGAYRQSDSVLTNTDGDAFCCLGVLADIQGCHWLPDADNDGMVPISPNGRKPWVDETNDMLPPKRAGGLSDADQTTLAEMNDNGNSFKQIAKFIEENF